MKARFLRSSAVVAAAAVMVFGAALVRPGGAEAARKYKVRVAAQQRTLDYVFAGRDWGKKYDLDLEIQFHASSKGPMNALLAGKADVGFVAPSRLLPVASRQKGRWAIFGNTYYGSKRHSLSVAKDAPYKKVEDLKGKKIAARVGSGNYETFLRVIKAKGLTIKDFRIVNMKPNNMPAALKQGLVDGFLAWEPTPATSEYKGISRILMNFEGWSVVPNYLGASKKFLQEHRDAAVRLLAAWMDASELMQKNPKVAAQIASAFQKKKTGVEVPERVHVLTLQRAHYVSWISAKEKELFRGDWEDMGKNLLKRKKIKSSPPSFDEIFDLSLQAEARKLRGSN